MKKLLLLSIIALIAFSSCKKWQHKYPEDTERTKLTPLERLTGKYWKLSKTIFNGMDYTDSVRNTIGDYGIYFSLQKDVDRTIGNITTNVEGGFGILWEMSINEARMSIFRMESKINNFPFVPCYENVIGITHHRSYDILKLTSASFKIQYTNSEHDTTIINEFTL